MLSLIFQMEIHKSEVQSSSGQKNKKKLFLIFIILYVFLFCLTFGEQQIF